MSFEVMKKDFVKFKQDHPFVFWSLIFYLGFLFSYIIIFLIFFADHRAAMSLNEIGDFLAGTFSPLAFLFLYLGYKQNSKALEMQATELRLSNEALAKQIEEMEKSVEAQQEMFKLAEKQYLESRDEKIKSSTPQIRLTGSKYHRTTPYHGGSYKHEFSLTIKVENLSIKNLHLRSSFWSVAKSGNPKNDLITLDIPSLDANQSVVIIFYKETDVVPFNNDTLYLNYYDEHNTKYQKSYQITKSDDGIVLLIENV